MEFLFLLALENHGPMAFLGVALPGSFNVISEKRPSQKVTCVIFSNLCFLLCAMFVRFR